jgi:predicted Zn-dependent peptidase
MELLANPVEGRGATVLEEMKQIILAEREDSKKQPEAISAALVQYNRYGQDSYFLRMLPDPRKCSRSPWQAPAGDPGAAELQARRQLHRHAAARKGEGRARRSTTPRAPASSIPPPYTYLKARAPEQPPRSTWSNKEAATANIRLEFGSVDYNPELAVPSQLYNSYFGGGMAGIVFQELREARALAYAAGAQYMTGYRKGDQNLMLGGIATQADKTVEATKAFIDLMDNMPLSEERFALARESIINNYRTAKIGFRDVISAVRGWERLGLEPDPRRARYATIKDAPLQLMTDFHKEFIANKTKLISVVGDKAKIDPAALGSIAPIKEVPIEEIFVK